MGRGRLGGHRVIVKGAGEKCRYRPGPGSHSCATCGAAWHPGVKPGHPGVDASRPGRSAAPMSNGSEASSVTDVLPLGRAARTRAVALLCVAAVVGALFVAQDSAAAVRAKVPAQVTLTGAGWGHGVGLSQYGAYGMALAGYTASDIVRHYYSGTTVAAVRDDARIRVNLLHGPSKVTMRTDAVDAGGGRFRVKVKGAADVMLGTGDRLKLVRRGDGVRVVARPAAGGRKVLGTGAVVAVRWAGTGQARRDRCPYDRPRRRHDDGWPEHPRAPLPRRVREGLAVLGGHRAGDGQPGEGERLPARDRRGAVLVAEGRAGGAGAGGPLVRDCRRWRSASVATAGATSTTAAARTTTRRSSAPPRWSGRLDPGGRPRSRRLRPQRRPAWRCCTPASRSPRSTARPRAGGPRRARTCGAAALPYAPSVDDHWALEPAVKNPYASWKRVATQAAVAKLFGLPDVVSLDISDVTAGDALATVTRDQQHRGRSHHRRFDVRVQAGLPSRWVTKADFSD